MSATTIGKFFFTRIVVRTPPKDGELCLSGVKPEETLVEARSDTNVQIVRGRKTNRTV